MFKGDFMRFIIDLDCCPDLRDYTLDLYPIGRIN